MNLKIMNSTTGEILRMNCSSTVFWVLLSIIFLFALLAVLIFYLLAFVSFSFTRKTLGRIIVDHNERLGVPMLCALNSALRGSR